MDLGLDLEGVRRIVALGRRLRAEELRLQDVLELITIAARELVACDGVGVALPKPGGMVYEIAVGELNRPLPVMVPATNSLTGVAFREGRTVATGDGTSDAQADQRAFESYGWRSGLFVPLFHLEGPALGVLGVVSRQPNAFSERETALVQLLADVVGGAVWRAEGAEARQALREREELLRVFFEESPLMTAVVELEQGDQRFLSINRAGAAFVGLQPEQVIGRTGAELGFPAEVRGWWTEKFEQCVRLGKPHRVYFRGRDGMVLSTLLCPLPTPPGAKQRACFITEDVTDRERLREQLATADRRAILGQLACGVAHELKNPLAFVRCNLQFIGEQLPPGPQTDELSAAIAESLHGVDHMKSILDGLLGFGRASPGTSASIDLRQVAERAAKMTHGMVLARADFTQRLQSTPTVSGDPVRISQVVVNLVMNASQAMRADGTRHAVKLSTGTDERGWAVIEVDDTGSGMAESVRSQLFQPFFTTKPAGEGNGLGLSICKEIVESAGGKIEVESELGVGTSFRVMLPPAA